MDYHMSLRFTKPTELPTVCRRHASQWVTQIRSGPCLQVCPCSLRRETGVNTSGFSVEAEARTGSISYLSRFGQVCGEQRRVRSRSSLHSYLDPEPSPTLSLWLTDRMPRTKAVSYEWSS